MKDLLVLLLQVLLGWLVFQIVSISIFFISLRSTHSTCSDEKLPKTAVVLSLRGADPFLANALRALLHQNYPAYDLKIVVDNITDPAWNVAINVITEFGASNCSLSVLKNPLSTCSLKCSSIVQAVSEPDASYQVVVLVDADAMVYTNWLRDLVSPLNTFILAVSYFVGYMIALVIFILLIDKRIRSIISKRCEILPKSSPLTAFKLLIALPLTQWINAIAMVASHWAPTIDWRGVTYRIKGRWNIKLIEYRPYQTSKSNNSKISL